MADSKNGKIKFYTADPRAVFPLNKIKVPKSLNQHIKKNGYTFTIDFDFPHIITKCSEREDTWINSMIIDSYIELHNLGFSHSVETWKDGQIVGGLYGVSIGGAFFGESMFTLESNASKAAFFFLAQYLKDRGFTLLDSQFINDHTKMLGAIEIPLIDYKIILNKAIKQNTSFK